MIADALADLRLAAAGIRQLVDLGDPDPALIGRLVALIETHADQIEVAVDAAARDRGLFALLGTPDAPAPLSAAETVARAAHRPGLTVVEGGRA